MSRVGKKPILIPENVEVELEGALVKAKGAKGEEHLALSPQMLVSKTDKTIQLAKPKDQTLFPQWGMSRNLIQNLILGVSVGFTKHLELKGVGYRAQVQGSNLKLNLGFSHDVIHPIPKGIKITCPSQTEIVIFGTNKQKVGQVAAEIRAHRPPEPYKGKGVHLKGEYVFRKEGKKK